MKLLLALFLGGILAGCGGGELRPDAVAVSSIEANYPSAEFSACGKLWNGLGYCEIEEGKDINDVSILVQGYYQGTVKFSSTCEFDGAPLVRYAESQLVPAVLSGPAKESCGVSFVVSPEYPNEQDQKFVIESFKGHVYIRVTKPENKYFSKVLKVKQGLQESHSIKVPVDLTSGDSFVSFLFRGCGADTEVSSVPVIDGLAEVKLSSLLSKIKVETCVINGVMFTSNDPVRITILMSGYDQRFDPLPIPLVSFIENKVEIRSDDNVSIVALDNTYVINREGTFEFDRSKSHVARMLTVKGRSILGIYSQEAGFVWMF